jgi:hypothetical protein
MQLSEEDKALVIGLGSSSIPPTAGMHKHFLLVLAQKARPASGLERAWLRYWLEWQNDREAQEQSAELNEVGDAAAAAAVDEFIAWTAKFSTSMARNDRVTDTIPPVSDTFWAKRPSINGLDRDKRLSLTQQFDGVVQLLAKRSYLVTGEVAVLAGCFRRLTDKPGRLLTPRQIAACGRMRVSLPARYGWWIHGGKSRYGKRR